MRLNSPPHSELPLLRSSTPAARPVQVIARQVGRLDPVDALAGAAALQLMPENATQIIRLEAFAHAMGTLAPNSGRQVNRQHLRRLLTGSVVESFSRNEDPKWDGFTEAFGFFGGSYIVLTGIEDHLCFGVHHLLSSIFQMPAASGVPTLPHQFIDKAFESAMVMLRLSDEVCRRAELERNIESVSRHWEAIDVPDAERIEALKAAVTFTEQDLRNLVREREDTPFAPWERFRAIPFDVMQGFMTEAGSVPSLHYEAGARVLMRRPIVRDGNRYVVAIPSALLGALRNTIVMLAHRMGLLNTLAQRFHASVRYSSVMRTLLTFTPTEHFGEQIDEPKLTCCSGDFYKFDADKLLYVVTVTDPLCGLDKPHWDTQGITAKISEHLRRTLEEFYIKGGVANDVLCLVATATPGRPASIKFDNPPPGIETFGTLNAAELEALLLVERDGPLALWKFLRARAEASRTTHFQSACLLDEFWFYRESGHCFVMEETRGPLSDYTHVTFDANAGGGLRYEMHKRRDLHTSPTSDGRGTGDVTTLHDTRDIPLYIGMESLSQREPGVLVEELPMPVWVLGTGDKAEEMTLHPTH